MNCLLIAIGSYGDVHPFVGLGRVLRQRGHDAAVVTNPHFAPLVERAGLGFLPLSTAEEYHAALRDPDIWHPVRSFGKVMTWVGGLIRPLYDLVAAQADAATVVAGHTLAFGALIAGEKHGIPTATIHVSPILFRSEYQVPAAVPGINFSRWPRWFKRLTWWAVDRFMIDRHAMPQLNAVRCDLGLPPVRRPFQHWIHSPQLTVGMFPEWFGPPQPDWPTSARVTSFPLFDEADLSPPQSEVAGFLDEGEPPIVFTPGSANQQAGQFFQAAVQACGILKRRGILLTRFAELVPARLPPGVRHFDYVPFTTLLPRTAALVHHGGIGTTAQAFAAAVPQLIMPLSHDQPDNADRVRRLGAGDWLTPRRFTGSRLAAKLDTLLHSEQTRRCCSELANRLRTRDGLRETCDLLEALGPAPARAHPGL